LNAVCSTDAQKTHENRPKSWRSGPERWASRIVMKGESANSDAFPAPGHVAPVSLEDPQGSSRLPVVPGYEVEGVLGRGGMGIVFRARHLRLSRIVALKMTLAGVYISPLERSRFQREAEAVARLQHPNVVQVYDVGDSDGVPYFTMEYVTGGSLAQKLSGVPQPAREAATLVGALAGAVHVAHQSEVVHRDIKPANVLLTAEGAPKISDFGLARRLDGDGSPTWTGMAVGTPSYMAPEQAQGKKDEIGPAVDIYSLGALLYEMLTGRPPFRADSATATIEQVVTRDPVPPAQLNPKVPRDLKTICLKCLHNEPRFRYATAAALADDLNCYLRGEAIAARPEGLLARMGRHVRRRPALAGALALAMASTIALVGGGLWLRFDRMATENERKAKAQVAEEDLHEMAVHLRASSWKEARAARDRALMRIGKEGPVELRRLADQGTRDLDVGPRFDAIFVKGIESSIDKKAPPPPVPFPAGAPRRRRSGLASCSSSGNCWKSTPRKSHTASSAKTASCSVRRTAR
jgi:eukaryotic-like serine/threonine-protein kinase